MERVIMSNHKFTIESQDDFLPFSVRTNPVNDMHKQNIKDLKDLIKTLIHIGSLIPAKKNIPHRENTIKSE
jgi:hypothetical protein